MYVYGQPFVFSSHPYIESTTILSHTIKYKILKFTIFSPHQKHSTVAIGRVIRYNWPFSALCLDKIAFEWTNCLTIQYRTVTSQQSYLLGTLITLPHKNNSGSVAECEDVGTNGKAK